MFEEEYLHISEDSAGSPVLSANEYEINRVTISRSSKRAMSPVKETGSKPKFLKLFDSIKVKENSALLLTCQVVGEPLPYVIW